MKAVLERLIAVRAAGPVESVPAWWAAHQSACADVQAPVDRALLAGASMDRVAWALASGYRAALESLFPRVPRTQTAALAATEARGGHPRAIETTLSGPVGARVLNGTKNYVTLGTFADILLVVASTGTDEQGRNRLVVVQVDAHAPGITLHPGPETPFAPELPHARAELSQVAVPEESILPGDGYSAFLKPFRTVEDLHVLAGLGGWLCTLARSHAWPVATVDELLSLLVALRTLALEDPSSPVIHLALDGTLLGLRGWIERAASHFNALPEPHRQRWLRDLPMLHVADRVRAARTATAWQRVA